MRDAPRKKPASLGKKEASACKDCSESKLERIASCHQENGRCRCFVLRNGTIADAYFERTCPCALGKIGYPSPEPEYRTIIADVRRIDRIERGYTKKVRRIIK